MATTDQLKGKRVLITGGARGIGSALAQRLHESGARLALVGLEPELLAESAARCGAYHELCDVSARDDVVAVVGRAAEALGGLDIVIANAGVGSQLPVLGGNPSLFDRTVSVNLIGAYNTIFAAAPHLAESRGYLLAISSLAAAIHLPLMSAYAASKAGVEALARSARAELRSSGIDVGIAYFAELDTDMTHRAFDTNAARATFGRNTVSGIAPLSDAIDALERGIARRSRTICSPWWVRPALPLRAPVGLGLELLLRGRAAEAARIAREESGSVGLTTQQP